MSLFHEFVGAYWGTTLIGFGQVFLVSGFAVAMAYWLKARLMPKRTKPIARKRSRLRARLPQRPTVSKVSARSMDAGHFVPVAPAEHASSTSAPGSMLDVHWQRAVEPLQDSIARGERANELHGRALVRLDSADYALQRLLLDLADVIPSLRQPVETAAAQPTGDVQEHAPAARRLAA